MNTRIQVEHPVTEMVTGLDLVRMQLEVASGRALSLSQLDVQIRGHAIEARLYAEDPALDFLPATGRVEVFRPPLGPGIRNDVGIVAGGEISPYYDPIIAKLIVHAENRQDAVERLRLALERYGVLGVTTNLSFLHWMCERPEFVAGRVDTGLVDRVWDAPPQELPDVVLIAAAAYERRAAPVQGDGRAPESPWQRGGGWRAGGVGQLYRYTYGERSVEVAISRAPEGRLRIEVGGETRTVSAESAGASTIVVREGDAIATVECVRRDDGLELAWKGRSYRLLRPDLQVAARGVGGRAHSSPTAPMPGTVAKVVVQEGQHVSAHEPLIVLEAMKMEHVIEAPHDGVVMKVLFREGELVPAGSPVVEMGEA
jgi:3-methylcrotonyl-CoA carboxylase alpha subunit